MKRNAVLKILNPILLLFFLNQTITVLFRENISHDYFRFFHINGGKIFLGLILLHFILNFNWVKANFFPKKNAR